ncbi:CAP domain-containing protein [Streptomyces sp. GC420]|uniref:CAP domain-containing protein n=1 Tax=Streptomyces sp. GC420 TaxID=2697568 RepID=UPI00141523E4|nr:CAP domain-containing protein [Streptomyces sp. GC420]NBM15206.1 CAP domain-containing protein [Streptomyces sp. GC420]
MGRHRRSAAPVATEQVDTAGRNRGASHRKKRAGVPVRTGLLGASAAMAMGAVAVASGIVPGGSQFGLGGSGSSDRVQSSDIPSGLETQGGEQSLPSQRTSEPVGDGSGRAGSSTSAASPSPSASASGTAEDAARGKKQDEDRADKADAAEDKDKKGQAPDGSGSSSGNGGKKTTAPAPPSAEAPAQSAAGDAGLAPGTGGATEAEAAVLALVNQERAKAGCSAVRMDSGLADLAGDFSEDMAQRGFFEHTDPDGDTPWARAEQAGIANLGGENIARGQTDAEAVMDAWMNSSGHRANILNCDYTTLGVGVHFAEGGPWWTQDFGF